MKHYNECVERQDVAFISLLLRLRLPLRLKITLAGAALKSEPKCGAPRTKGRFSNNGKNERNVFASLLTQSLREDKVKNRS